MDTLELTQAAGIDIESDTPDVEQVEPVEGRQIDFAQFLFWGLIMVAVAAASVAIAWPKAVGSSGSVMLIAMAAGGLVVMLWLLRGPGRKLGLFPERGAAAAAVNANLPRFAWIEALDEAVLVSERGGAPVAGNTAYSELVSLALGPTSLIRLGDLSPLTEYLALRLV